MKINHIADYRLKRADAYPDVKEQLDMLWHAMEQGSAVKIEPFFTSIERVKRKYPKPDISI